MDRKSFLGLGLGATLSLPLRGSQEWLPKHQVSRHQIPQADWKTLRSLFPLEKNRTFLNNGTMGITPYPVLEAVQKSYLHIAEKAAYPHRLQQADLKNLRQSFTQPAPMAMLIRFNG